MTSYVYIDDDPNSRDVMRVILTLAMQEPNVTILDDSTDYISRLGAVEPQPDIILLDIHMRPHNGFEVLNGLRQHPTYASKRIVALTASVMNEEIKTLREAGFDGVIAKPVDQTILPGILERIKQGEKVWTVAY
jgi:CheY-like chemotaxis protein